MTTAAKEIQRLDRFLRVYGSGVGTLTRVVGTTNQSSYSVDVRAHVRDYAPDELSTSIIQGDSHVIISSSEINAAQWPGAQPTPPTPTNDVRVPRRGDKFVWQGKTRNVEELTNPIYLDNVLVRLEFRIRG